MTALGSFGACTMRRLAAHERLDPAWRDWFVGWLQGAVGEGAG